MAKLIAAGGTGQEVAAAVLRLSYLSALDVPDIAVFDSDLAPRGGATTKTRTEMLTELHHLLHGLGAIGDASLKTYNPTHDAAHNPQSAPIHQIEDAFKKYNNLEKDDELLLNLFLDDHQRDLTIDDGFHGEPAVGALAFASAVEGDAFDDFLGEIRNSLATQDGLRALFAGSIVGGVGTSVIPILMREIAHMRAVGNKGDNAAVLSLFQLAWFKLQHTSDPLSEPNDVDAAMFDRNTSGLLKGYLDMLETAIDSIILVGLPEQVARVSHGGNMQGETDHYLCVASGMMAANLLRDDATQRMVGKNWKGIHAPSVEGGVGKTHEALDGAPHGPAIFIGDGKALSVRSCVQIARCLSATSRVLEFETASGDPATAQHSVVAKTLAGLGNTHEREAFKATLSRLSRLHQEILLWFGSSLKSDVEGNRADTIGAFEPVEDWAEFLSDSDGSVLAVMGVNPWLAIGRRILSRVTYRIPETASGNDAAWSLMDQTRQWLITRLSR